ncbi:suppressor APC domain-containing protein 2, partial [Carlito syrichta]|uniref:Suppressor APC domain-containing protein 2 n=1 Tax=Carlito syrichta TaxID=1868482 RepID=A0A3Q0DGA8_CARSF
SDGEPGPCLSAAGAAARRALEASSGDARQVPRARGERRRHTITNGVDCGLWYQQQLQRVQERQRRLGQSRASPDLGAAGSPRPLGQLLPKVQEVARCLGELLAAACAGRVSVLPARLRAPEPSCSPPDHVLPQALPAASASPPGWQQQQQTIFMLKEQNRLLTQEVTSKSERITQLEQEKSALIKQLFEARALSQQDAGPLDSTFI